MAIPPGGMQGGAPVWGGFEKPSGPRQPPTTSRSQAAPPQKMTTKLSEGGQQVSAQARETSNAPKSTERFKDALHMGKTYVSSEEMRQINDQVDLHKQAIIAQRAQVYAGRKREGVAGQTRRESVAYVPMPPVEGQASSPPKTVTPLTPPTSSLPPPPGPSSLRESAPYVPMPPRPPYP